jgi:hypothetical protein
VDGRCTSSHGNKTSRNRSVVKQKGMVFGFRKTATAVVGPEIDRNIPTDRQTNKDTYEYRTVLMRLCSCVICVKNDFHKENVVRR